MAPDPLAWLDDLQGSGIRPGLGRIRALLRKLGNPQRACPAILVAGTNGKGSTSATLASILNASGYRTAHYTSPHLVHLNERWSISGEPIDDERLRAAISKLRVAAHALSISPTYFEALTVVAFIAFADAACDVSVLEVGMGGRLDATNVVRPVASVIAPVGFDHMEYLGRTLRRIAGEKAGIIHRGAIVLTSNEEPVVRHVIERRASSFGSRVIYTSSAEALPSPLEGDFQRQNVGLAVRTARELASRFPRITEETIRRGVAETRWRGRLELFERRGKQIRVDGCHNAHAVAAVVPFIEKTLPRPRTLVFGMMADKNFAEVSAMLFPLFDSVIATEPYPPRSLIASGIVARANELGIPATAMPDPRAAFQYAMESRTASIFVGGSLYLAGAAVAFLDSCVAE